MSDWGAGREPEPGSQPARPRKEPPALPALPPDDQPPETKDGVDLVGVAAVVVGFLGIVVFGILAALIAAILGSIAGQRARDAGRSLELAYLAFILAAVDGIVWLVLHLLFDISIQVG